MIVALHLRMLKDFRAFQLSKEIYQIAKTLKLPAHLKEQLLRASASIALNLAESSGNRTEKERTRFCTLALGSLRECQAIIDLESIQHESLDNSMNQLGAILFKMSRLQTSAFVDGSSEHKELGI